MPLVPVTVTVKLPIVDPVQDKVEVADVVVTVNATLAGVSVHVRPVDGDTVSDRETVPVKPLVALTVMVDAPAVPEMTLTVVGLAATVKSVTVKVAVVV